MKKFILLLLITFCFSCKNEVKEAHIETEADKVKKDSLEFNAKIENLKFKAKLQTVDEKVKLRNWVSLIKSDVDNELKERGYKELVKYNDIFSNINYKTLSGANEIESLERTIEEGLDQVAYAKEFKKFSDSIQAISILLENNK